jgi:hypothetical protein
MCSFLDNKYTSIYYNLIESAKSKNRVKQRNDGLQYHHIIPRCFGGADDITNIVLLTYREHRICHRLLINMTEGEYKYKMMYAYLLFDPSYDTSGIPSPQIYCTKESYRKMSETRKKNGSYKIGKENNFSSPEIINQVRQRMIDNNPMKSLKQRARMKENNNNPHCKPVEVAGLSFPSLGAAARYFNTTPYLLKKNYALKRD